MSLSIPIQHSSHEDKMAITLDQAGRPIEISNYLEKLAKVKSPKT
jgi:hypothetical protein